jgi:hypothetical protein
VRVLPRPDKRRAISKQVFAELSLIRVSQPHILSSLTHAKIW